MYILGINNGHDSSAALIKDGKVVVAAQEERFNRIKHYFGLPVRAVDYCLSVSGVDPMDLDYVSIPTIKRAIDVYALFEIRKHGMLLVEEKPALSIDDYLKKLMIFIASVMNIGNQFEFPIYAKRYKLKKDCQIVQIEHHQSHAASAYYTSGFDRCLVVTADGAGDAASGSVWIAEKGKLELIDRIGREGSLGFFYNVVTEALGWQVSEGEGKVMGLAPYGTNSHTKGKLDFCLPRFENGRLSRPYNFGFPNYWLESGMLHWHFKETDIVKKLVDKYGRENIAYEAQECLEREMINLIKPNLKKYGVKKLAVAGGVFLNVKMNQKIWESCNLDDFFILPDAGDSGIALGSALYTYFKNNRYAPREITSVYWGKEYSDEEIRHFLDLQKIGYKKLTRTRIIKDIAKLLSQGKIVGWFQGRMEVGPRALGNRSILMDPRYAKNKDIINNQVKFREPFRPFCPSMTPQGAKMFLVNPRKAPFMIISFTGNEDAKKKIPAVVHVDGTLRPQIIERKDNPNYYDLINEFGKITGVPVLLNTSFNIRGEAIVESPRDAIRCFFDTGIDFLIIGSFLIGKK